MTNVIHGSRRSIPGQTFSWWKIVSPGRALACLFGFILLLAGRPATADPVEDEIPDSFPFVIPPADISPSFTDMSFLNPTPAGADGFVTIRDGHFIDGGGRRLRLLGTNLTFAGAFPPKEFAPLLAGHLRKLGFNVVRFHHIDSRAAPQGLWLPDFSAFDPRQMEKLDGLIHQLIQHGIFINLNLHVSRSYPGLPADIPRDFLYGKGLDIFYPPFIRLQKDYARMLLRHRNPHTGRTYAEEPAVVVVELTNENALTHIRATAFRTMPDPFKRELQTQWTAWLTRHYGSTAALRKAWKEWDVPLGKECLRNADFSTGLAHWTMEAGGGGALTPAIQSDDTVAGKRALLVETKKMGRQPWNLQVHQTGLDLRNGRPYTFSFAIRSDKPRSMFVGVFRDRAPWTCCNFRTDIQATPSWQRHEFTFVCRDAEPNHSRISFNFNNQLGRFWIAEASLRPGGSIGLPAACSLEAANIPLWPTNAGKVQQADFHRFLIETEQRYVKDMRHYLRQELRVRAHICCTEASYGGLAGLFREGRLSDFLDRHGYWQHPVFPGRPWDGNNWYIDNTSMTAAPNGGTLASRAWTRMIGKPFTISEYDHPAPNDYAAEMFPMICSFAALQDWDGIYQFTYSSRATDWEKPRISTYFELCAHPGKLAFLPVAAILFRTGALSPRLPPLAAKIPQDDPGATIAQNGADYVVPDACKRIALRQAVGFRFVPGTGPPIFPEIPAASVAAGPRDAIVWQPEPATEASYTVNTPQVKVALGFIAGNDIVLGNTTIHVTKASNRWAAVGVAALDGKPLDTSMRILVVAVGRVGNSHMEWRSPERKSLRRWGEAPTRVEGIGATILLPGRKTLAALDGCGTPTQTVPGSYRNGKTRFILGPRYRTLWYAAR